MKAIKQILPELTAQLIKRALSGDLRATECLFSIESYRSVSVPLCPLVYTLHEAAAICKVSVSFLKKMHRLGKLGMKTLGNKHLILAEELNRFLIEELADLLPRGAYPSELHRTTKRRAKKEELVVH